MTQVTTGSVRGPHFRHVGGFTLGLWTAPCTETTATDQGPPSWLITAGDDCYVHLIKSDSYFESPDSVVVRDISLTAQPLCLSAHMGMDMVAIGMDMDPIVQLYRISSGELVQGSLCRCTLPVRSILFSPCGRWLFVAADDMSLRRVDVRDGSNQFTIKHSHSKSIKHLTCDPFGDYLATAGCDGFVHIHHVNPVHDKDPRPSIVVSGVSMPVMEPDIDLLTIAWNPVHPCLAIPSKSDRTVKLVETRQWRVQTSIPVSEGPSPVFPYLVCWSANGEYLAVASSDQKVRIFAIPPRAQPHQQSMELVSTLTAADKITSIDWSKNGRWICVMDENGEELVWTDPIPDGWWPADQVRKEGVVAGGEAAEQARSRPQESSSAGRTEPKKPKSKLVDEAAAEDDLAEDDGMMSDLGMDLGDDDDMDDFIVDDEQDVYGLRAKQKEPARPSALGAALKRFEVPDFQPTFQPNSSLTRGNRRYLALNMIGAIVSIDQSTHHAVDINFHDVSSRRPVHFKDHYGFSMGVLTERAALFAAPLKKNAKGEQEHASVVYYKPFDSWTTGSEWTMFMEEKESIDGIAMSLKWAAVATSHKNIRLFSATGLQTGVFTRAGGPLVCMAADDNYLMLVYYGADVSGAPFEFELYDVEQRRFVVQGKLPLSPGAKLEWIGFSESGFPCTYDSEGVLRGMLLGAASCWNVLLDTRPARKGKQEWMWPVSVTDETFIMVICKAGETQPYFPSPILSDLKLALPLLAIDSPSTVLEEQLFRQMLLYQFHHYDAEINDEVEDREEEFIKTQAAMDKNMILLIAQACKAEKPARALELCGMLFLEKSMEIAYQLAGRHHMPQLAERIEQIKKARFDGLASVHVSSNMILGGSSAPIAAQRPETPYQPVKRKQVLQPRSLADPLPISPAMVENPDETINIERERYETVEHTPAPKSRINPFKKRSPVELKAQAKSIFESVQQPVNPKQRQEKRAPAGVTGESKKRKTTQATLSFGKSTTLGPASNNAASRSESPSGEVAPTEKPVKTSDDSDFDSAMSKLAEFAAPKPHSLSPEENEENVNTENIEANGEHPPSPLKASEVPDSLVSENSMAIE